MRAGDDPKLFWALDAHEPHEVLHVTFIRSPRLLIADIPKPLDGRGHLGEPVELGGRERPRTLLDDQGLVIVFLPFVFRQAFTHDNVFIMGKSNHEIHTLSRDRLSEHGGAGLTRALLFVVLQRLYLVVHWGRSPRLASDDVSD
jgi:hypothetical protein